jgi:hypothetical protein
MLTIPIQSANPPRSQVPALTTVLVIGRSEKALNETVELLRHNGQAAGATNDFDNVLALFDVASLNTVVFGGMVPPETKKTLRADLATANPTITFIQGFAGIPGLIAAQFEAAAVPSVRDPGMITCDADSRTVTISLQAPEKVRVIGFWHTAFVPPDPESTSEIIFDGELNAGTHTVPIPASVPTAASFVVVHVGSDVHPFVLGPMPRGTTMASPPA